MQIMVRRYFAPALVGMDLEEIGAVIYKLHGGVTVIQSPKPVWKSPFTAPWRNSTSCRFIALLGGPYRRQIELVGSLAMDLCAESIGAKAQQLEQDGYRQFKLKIGHKELQ